MKPIPKPRTVEGRQLAPAGLDDFRSYVRAWIPTGLPRMGEQSRPDEPLEKLCRRHRALQRRLWDAGLAGILYPLEFGGLSLTREHQEAFFEEAEGYELPRALSVTHGILIPTLLDYGTEAQKRRHIPAALRGDEMWVQLLSEPSGGSDMAAALCRATRHGEAYVVNGSKVWSTFAHVADFGMLLCRTDSSLPKHRGLSMLIVPLVPSDQLTIQPIRLATGDSDFAQEFFDDLTLPLDSLIGEENDGWSVASRLLFHERNMIGDNSLHDSQRGIGDDAGGDDALVTLARELGVADDPVVRQLVGEGLMWEGIIPFARERINAGLVSGALPGPGAALLKLVSALAHYRKSEIAVHVAGASGAVWTSDRDATAPGVPWLGARIGTIAGGTNEMQRNVVSERVLGLPREFAPDKDLPFSDVRHNG